MTTTEEQHGVHCDLQRSTRYHRARERFFQSWSSVIGFISLLSGSAVVVSLLSKGPDWVALAAGSLIAISQAFELIGGLSAKSRLHNSLASEFIALERELVSRGDLSATELQDLKGRILTVESREPPIKRYLDIICHNQVARSIGSQDIATLWFWQRWFAQWLNGDNANAAR